MTVQPTDTEAFLWLDRLDDAVKRRAYDCTCQVGGVDAMSIDTDWLRHALSEIRRAHRNMSERVGVAEHRATRAEAERDEWREASVKLAESSNQANADLYEAEARIKAVEDVHYPAHNDRYRTPFCPDCKGAPGVHECGCWQDEQQEPVCGHCRGWKGMGPVEWPCPTIRALESVPPPSA